MKLKHFFYLPIAIISTVAVTSCLNDDNGDNPDIKPGFISFINAMPDTSALDFYVGNTQEPLGGSSIPYTERYPEDSYIDAPPYQYQLFVAFPDETNTSILDGAFNISQDIYHSVFVYNTSDDTKAFLLADDLKSPASGMAKVRFLHLGTDAPAVDLLVEGETTPWFDDYAFIEDPEETDEIDGFEEVEAGTYSLQVKDSETGDVLAAESVNLEDSKIYTLWLGGIHEETEAKALRLESIEHIEFEPTTTP